MKLRRASLVLPFARRIFAWILLYFASHGVLAQGNALLVLPADFAPARAMEAARTALLHGGWTLVSSDPTAIIARNGNSMVRVYVAGNALRYDDHLGTVSGPFKQQRNQATDAERLEPVSPALIAALRGDLASAVQQGSPPAPTATKPAAATLVGYIPPNASEAEVLQIARTSFVSRRWALVAAPQNLVRARLARHGYDADVTVFMDAGELKYTKAGEVPENWIENLRSDISRRLDRARAANNRSQRVQGVPPQTATQAPAGSGRAAERLRSLKQLLDSGIITRDEYDKKRTEILKDL